MSNKTQLQTNNTALDGYIARINAAKEVAAGLPEAGGGGSGGGSNFYEETFTTTGNTTFTHNLGVVPTRLYITIDPSIDANNTSLSRTIVSASGTASTSCSIISAMPYGATQVLANNKYYVINGSGSNITADASTLTYSG